MPVLSEFGDSVRYLEFYHHCAQSGLSSSFDKEFWSRITLQMAHSEPAVRHALIALGFLYENEPGNMKHARSNFAANSECGVLISHYNKSVRCLVDRITEPSCPPELALVTCVLFICIEFLRGNWFTGYTHLANGLKIISEQQQGRRQNRPKSAQSSNSHTNSVILSSTSTMIEENIVPIFVRGIASALMYGVNAEEVFNIPWPRPTVYRQTSFTSLRQAQEVYYELRNASILHIRQVATKYFKLELPNNDDLQHHNELIECHRSWLQNLEQFEQQTILSKQDIITTTSLRASHHATFIYASCSMDIQQMQYDTHFEMFKEINRLGKFLIDAQAPNKTHSARFTFEISVIPALYFVATRCRCPKTRREAVSLLGRNLRREGLWDAEQQAIVSNRCIEMEERELDPVTGWPVASTRLWSSVIDANMDSDGGFWVTFLPAKYLGAVGPEILKTKLIWERMYM